MRWGRGDAEGGGSASIGIPSLVGGERSPRRLRPQLLAALPSCGRGLEGVASAFLFSSHRAAFAARLGLLSAPLEPPSARCAALQRGSLCA